MTADTPFTWSVARSWITGLPEGAGVNIAFEAVDRHVAAGRGDRVAMRFLPRHGAPFELTYRELAEETNRFANVLGRLGVTPGERVFVLCGRVPELYIAVLGALKARNVVCPLFSAFGPEPIAQRLKIGDGRVLLTSPELYGSKVEAIRADLPALAHVLVTGHDAPPGTTAVRPLLDASSPNFTIAPTAPEDPALLHFTSGTTGTPKGAIHVHDAVVTHHATGRLVLGLGGADVFWCTADPGWVTGMSYGIIAPLTCGVTSIIDEGDFNAERWYRILADERVNVWYTAPTAIRMLMRAGAEAAEGADLSALRLAASVGEPLAADAVLWGRDVLGQPFYDNWWQTETGGIMVANRPGDTIKPGSMGRPIPGIVAAVLACDDEGVLSLDGEGRPHEVTDPDTAGMLALRAPWPSMFRSYLGQPERYQRCFVAGWYLSGDLVRRDADGAFWFVARADDVIKTAGHLIGPFEVESVLVGHAAVAEAGVYGVPDPVAGAVVHAALVLRPGHEASDAVLRDVKAYARRHLGAAVAPRDFVVVANLPKTRSGKILRRVLRARELGLPEGDLSMLEPANV